MKRSIQVVMVMNLWWQSSCCLQQSVPLWLQPLGLDLCKGTKLWPGNGLWRKIMLSFSTIWWNTNDSMFHFAKLLTFFWKSTMHLATGEWVLFSSIWNVTRLKEKWTEIEMKKQRQEKSEFLRMTEYVVIKNLKLGFKWQWGIYLSSMWLSDSVPMEYLIWEIWPEAQ